MVFSALYFGSWIPHSIIAKEVSWHHLFPVFDPVRIFGAYLPVEFMRNSFSVLKFLVLAVLIAPVVIELAGLWKEKSALVLFPLFFLLYNLFFSFGRVLMADWYLLPGYTAYIVTAGSLAGRYLKQRSAMLQYGIITLSGVVLLIMFFTGAVRWQNNPGGLSIRQNKNLGIWLKQNASIYSQVLVEPIGAIGWESNMYVYDYIGMVSPKIVQYRKQFPTSDAWYAPFLKQERPEFIVQRNWELPENALFQGHGDGMFANDADKTWFEKTYSKVDWNPRAALDDSVYLVIYRRNAE